MNQNNDKCKLCTAIIILALVVVAIITLLIVVYLGKCVPPIAAGELAGYGAILLVILALVCAMAIFGCTKKKGFGAYNTSTLIFILVLPIAAALTIIGKIEGPSFVQILMAAIGFAGGLFASKKGEEKEVDDPSRNAQNA